MTISYEEVCLYHAAFAIVYHLHTLYIHGCHLYSYVSLVREYLHTSSYLYDDGHDMIAVTLPCCDVLDIYTTISHKELYARQIRVWHLDFRLRARKGLLINLVVKTGYLYYYTYYFGPILNLGAYAPGPLGMSNPANTISLVYHLHALYILSCHLYSYVSLVGEYMHISTYVYEDGHDVYVIAIKLPCFARHTMYLLNIPFTCTLYP